MMHNAIISGEPVFASDKNYYVILIANGYPTNDFPEILRAPAEPKMYRIKQGVPFVSGYQEAYTP